uniref:Recombination protein RecR n=1 Tax=Lygus hesperus TaxID=30085 RepID=A0A0A9X758_LYGHE
MSVRGVSCMALVHSTICSSDVIAHVRSHSPILLSFKIYTIQLQKMRKYLVIHFSKFLMTVSHTLVTSTMYICSWRTGGYDTSTTNPCTGSLVCSRATTTIAMVRRYTVRCTHMYVPCAPHTHTHTGMKTHIWSRIGQGEKSNAEYLLTKHVIESIDNKSASIFSLPSCKSFYSPSSGHTLYCSQYFLPKHDPLSLFQKAKVSKMFNTESVDAAASRKGAPGSLFTNSDLSNLYRKLQLAPDPLPPPRLPRDVFIQLDPSQPQRDHHCICVTQEQIDAIEKSTTMHSEALDGCDTTSLLCRVKPTESVLLYHRQHQHDNSHRKQYKEVDNVVNITDSIHPGYTDNTASIPRAFTVPTTRTRIRR